MAVRDDHFVCYLLEAAIQFIHQDWPASASQQNHFKFMFNLFSYLDPVDRQEFQEDQMAEEMTDFETCSRAANEHAGKTMMVDIRMNDEREFHGELYLEPGQSLRGLMNSDAEFIPIRTLAGEVHLLNKHSIEDIHELQGCA